MTADQILTVALRYQGVIQGSTRHRQLIDAYNRVQPLPVGYRMTYHDNWCDTFVTVVADQAGGTSLVGRECGVHRHLKLLKSKGIWLGRVRPRRGDIIIFDWDGQGFADHIGYVTQSVGDYVHTIEGNSGRCVARRSYAWNDWRIMGYARPRYVKDNETDSVKGDNGDEASNDKESSGAKASSKGTPIKKIPIRSSLKDMDIVNQVIRGQWGVGTERYQKLRKAGYDPDRIQHLVNKKLHLRRHASIKRSATHWMEGGLIPDWIKGIQLTIVGQKPVNHSQSCFAYLLSRQGIIVGWIYSHDLCISA